MHVVLAQHMANVLAEVAFDTLAKFLHSFDIRLGDAPRAIGSVGRPRLEFRDALLYFVIPRHVGDQVFYVRKCLHRLNRNRLIQSKSVEARHAHQFRHAVYFCRAGAAFPGLAIPANGQISGLFRLYLMNDVEDHHAIGNLSRVVAELSLASLAAPDPERGRRHYFISSIICCSSCRIGAIGSCENCIRPSAPFRTTMLNPPKRLSFSGKSSRKWAPRLSFRSSAARVTISETVSRW